MKKKLLVLFMGMMMSMTMLTACGDGEKDSSDTKKEQSEKKNQDADDADEDEDEEEEERKAKSDKGYETPDELVNDFQDWIVGKVSDEEWALGYDPIIEASFRIGFSNIGGGDIADCAKYIPELQKDDSEMDSYIREQRDKYLDYDLMERIAEKKQEFQSYGDNFKKFNVNYSLYNYISVTYNMKDQDVKEVTLYIMEYDDMYYWVAMESK